MKYPKNGRFGEFGGKYIPETLVPAIEELEENYLKFKNDKDFKKSWITISRFTQDVQLHYTMQRIFQRNLAEQNLSQKRGLVARGAHKINNTLGQALLAKK